MDGRHAGHCFKSGEFLGVITHWTVPNLAIFERNRVFLDKVGLSLEDALLKLHDSLVKLRIHNKVVAYKVFGVPKLSLNLGLHVNLINHGLSFCLRFTVCLARLTRQILTTIDHEVETGPSLVFLKWIRVSEMHSFTLGHIWTVLALNLGPILGRKVHLFVLVGAVDGGPVV